MKQYKQNMGKDNASIGEKLIFKLRKSDGEIIEVGGVITSFGSTEDNIDYVEVEMNEGRNRKYVI